jgi:hypothetical protein
MHEFQLPASIAPNWIDKQQDGHFRRYPAPRWRHPAPAASPDARAQADAGDFCCDGVRHPQADQPLQNSTRQNEVVASADKAYSAILDHAPGAITGVLLTSGATMPGA